MKYSFNKDSKKVIFAGMSDINVSYKDLGAVCDAIRYKNVNTAVEALDSVIYNGMPIYYRRHSKHLGARHELHGRKGRYPKKCAKFVKKVLQNAISMAESKGYDTSDIFVVHASANKTQTMPRRPSRGILFHPGFGGYASARRSNLELAKIEVGVAEMNEVKFGEMAMHLLKKNADVFKKSSAQQKPQPKKQKKAQQKPAQVTTAPPDRQQKQGLQKEESKILETQTVQK